MTVLGKRWELGEVLGSGGFGTVYRARDLEEQRDVAIKITPHDNEDNAERFRREALAVSQLRSPNVVRVFDFGNDETLGLYLVMELVEGVPLEPARLGRVLLAHEVLRAAHALLAGLAEAHASHIVHRDIKPANVIVPVGPGSQSWGLADLKLIDFGISRSERRAQLDAEEGVPLARDSRRALGTPAYMAPELLLGEESSPASDVYAVGLVLYELIGHTLLFPGHAAREQLTIRTQKDPSFVKRVPAPLDEILAKMLSRTPSLRFADAGEALTALVNIETAPMDLDEFAASIGKPAAEMPPQSRATPPLRKSTAPAPMSVRVHAEVQAAMRIDDDGVTAFRAILGALDIAMLDALARRERDNDLGRAARAFVLAMRLETDAAAEILEPLRARPALARGIAVTVLAPRARVATRARLLRGLTGEDDAKWIDEIDLEIGQLLVSIEAALCGPAAMTACLARAERLLARSHAPSPARTTLALAQIAMSAGVRNARAEGKEAWDALAATDAAETSPLVTVVRSIILAPLAFRTDDHVARASFERAADLARQSGATLFEARALSSLGGMLVEIPGRFEQGRSILERVTALLLNADAPSLEHLAAHNRGVALVVERQFAGAARQFRRAREVAAGEVPLELELLSGAQEVEARLAAGDFDEARAVARKLEMSRNVDVAPREAMIVAIACSLVRLLDDGVEAARADLTRGRERGAAARDTLLLAQALDLIFASMAGEQVDWLARAAELHRTAEEHGYAPFYWFEATRAFVARLPDEKTRAAGIYAVDRLLVLLGRRNG